MATNKKNYDKLMWSQINEIKEKGNKPNLLLHVCCGPCSTIPLKILKPYFNITIFYSNSNIYPKEEYLRRLNELKRYLIDSKNNDIHIVEYQYNYEEYIKDLIPYKELKEGHERCRMCFKKRFLDLVDYASKHNYQYISTVMTISRYKNAQDINEIGLALVKDYPSLTWLYNDFKKNNGYEKSLIVCKNYNLYFQEYCGCEFSFRKKKDDGSK